MSERPTVIVDPDAIARKALASHVDGAIELDRIDQLEQHLNGPTVVIFGPSLADAEGVATAAPILSTRPAVGGVLISESLSTELLQSALRAGFKDVLTAPVDRDELVDTIARVSTTLPGINLPSSSHPRAEDEERGRMITVFSTKGGAGKSVIATNVAVSLARQTDRPVVLVDADLQFGDVSVMLKLAPHRTVVDAVGAIDKLDASLLRSLLVEHEESGLLVLSAPLEPAFADQVEAKQLIEIIHLLRSMAAYVVVDTPAHFNDVVLALIEESDDVLLVAGLDIPSIKNVRIGLQTLRLLNTPMQKVRLVLNRANSKVKLDVAEVERTLQVQAQSRIPSDVSVPQSVNKGEPIVIDAPRSGPAKAIEALVTMLLEEQAR
ncbi:AAA family ATPase [Actinospongicola halichondriae]|uniref:AAA family ATPase n=1 Tax=Actinospongicola halichondriae TaxID=3236844 RepID=UPI003D53F3E1